MTVGLLLNICNHLLTDGAITKDTHIVDSNGIPFCGRFVSVGADDRMKLYSDWDFIICDLFDQMATRLAQGEDVNEQDIYTELIEDGFCMDYLSKDNEYYDKLKSDLEYYGLI